MSDHRKPWRSNEGDVIETLFDRWARAGTEEDDVLYKIDDLLVAARVLDVDDDGVAGDVAEADGVHDKRIAILTTLAYLAGIEPPETGPWHIVGYSVTREYGGPEEGGWWYDWYSSPTPVATVHTDRRQALRIARDQNTAEQRDREEAGRPQGRFSVLGGADWVYVVETEIGAHESKERPHYE